MIDLFRFRRFGMGIALSLGIGLLPAAVLAADIALVIGNHSYRKAPRAESAAIDARVIAEALEDGGYDVTLGIDLTRNEMRRQLAGFGRKIGSADRVVFFFSGHALRTGGASYLAPVDQDDDSLVEVMLDSVPLELVLRMAERKPGRAVVFIDAAQLDGFAPRSFVEPGLAHIDPGKGVMVVSAAAPGRAVRRGGAYESRFARQILRNFLEPGTSLSEATRNLRGPIWVAGQADPGLELVPRGRSRVIGGGGSGRDLSPAEVEAALGLTREQRRSVQENLSLLGHDPRGIDGVFGPGSRTAIRLWQRSNNLIETGYMTGEQLALLNRQADEAGRPAPQQPPASGDERYWSRTGAQGAADGYRAYLTRYSDGAHATEARDALKQMARAGTDPQAVAERRDWRQARLNDTPGDYHDYLRRYPSGIWLPEAEERLAALDSARAPAPAPRDPQAEENALGLARNDRLSVEQRLNYLRFPPGNIDGFFDENTRWAIEGYQRSRGFEATGYLDQPTIVRLLEETGGSQPGIVIDGAAVLRQLLGGN